jgi:hypothetical protein
MLVAITGFFGAVAGASLSGRFRQRNLRRGFAGLGGANVADYATRFVSALNADAIQPIDFI